MSDRGASIASLVACQRCGTKGAASGAQGGIPLGWAKLTIHASTWISDRSKLPPKSADVDPRYLPILEKLTTEGVFCGSCAGSVIAATLAPAKEAS